MEIGFPRFKRHICNDIIYISHIFVNIFGKIAKNNCLFSITLRYIINDFKRPNIHVPNSRSEIESDLKIPQPCRLCI